MFEFAMPLLIVSAIFTKFTWNRSLIIFLIGSTLIAFVTIFTTSLLMKLAISTKLALNGTLIIYIFFRRRQIFMLKDAMPLLKKFTL
jgi:hypothetical protein